MSTPIRATRRRRSLGLAVGLSLAAGTLGLATPASAADPPPPPTDTATTTTFNSVTVTYNAGTGGTPPTFFDIRIDPPPPGVNADPGTVGATVDYPNGFVTFSVGSGERSKTISGLAASTTYNVQVCARTERDFGCGPRVPAITPAAPTTPPPGVTPSGTGPFAPFFTGDAFIRQNFVDYTGRPPRLDELNFFREVISDSCSTNNDDDTTGTNPGGSTCLTRGQFLEFLRQQPEQDPAAAGIVRLYQAYFLRRPDFGGYEHYRKTRAEGIISLFRISAQFADSSEFKRTYGSLDNGEFVSLVYRNVLGRNPDASGFDFYLRRLDAGVSRGAVMLSFSESNEFVRRNKVAVAVTEIFAAMLDRVPTEDEYSDFTRIFKETAGQNSRELNQKNLDVIYNRILNVEPLRTEYIGRVNLRCGVGQAVTCYGATASSDSDG